MVYRVLPLFALALAGTSLAPNRSLQQSSVPQQSIATLRTGTRLVVVDVVVLDRNKQPVHGLKAEDFTLLENGTAQRFKGFEEHAAPTAEQLAKVQALTPAVKLQPGTFSNFAAARFNGPMNVLLLDKLNTSKADQKQMQKQINDFLDRARTGQRMAVFTLTDQLVMTQGFTDDVDLLRKAVNGEKGLTGSPLLSAPTDMKIGRFDTPTSQSTLDDDSDASRGPQTSMSLQDKRKAAEMVEFRRSITLQAMNGMALYLGTLPGRKNMVWFSGSFPVVTMLAMGIELQGVKYSSEREFQETTALLSRSQTAVYPIDVKGLNLPSIFTAEDNGCGGCGTGNRTVVMAAINTAMSDHDENNFGEHSTMFQMAGDTGGKAFVNTNDFTDAMTKALDDGANYYTIAYTPSNSKWDGGLRRIQVKLREKGYELSYRRGYFADGKDTQDEVAGIGGSRGMQVALMHGAPEPTQLLFSTHVQPVSAVTENDAAPRNKPAKGVAGPFRRYRVDYAIDPREIRFAQGSDGKRHETLEFVIYVYDAAGRLVDSVGQSIKTAVTSAEYAQFLQTGVPFHQEVSVPAKGEFTLRVAMRDVEANLVGAVELPVESVEGLQPLEAAATGGTK